jgi:hypothetical protein
LRARTMFDHLEVVLSKLRQLLKPNRRKLASFSRTWALEDV